MSAKHHITFRQTETDRKLLENLAKETNLTISDLVLAAIHKTYYKNKSLLKRESI
ncbi:MAG: hypothetical protein UX01_C0010G0009 [Candidatus Collierbacteria bacterium GW2011_GWB2_45_17]|uniref:Uncharacterized protein n=1 Tax=Candidatus Collierbacteria bacterium GW2011_GWB2_45_17 TaxID=1618388 RepID=A0A837IHJ3_9BACT|nr:MAG: hypothetical protein UX01_C0010G0009 [Candidatus Collierbacteria bacterium GW2011_GWB2_45_17]